MPPETIRGTNTSNKRTNRAHFESLMTTSKVELIPSLLVHLEVIQVSHGFDMDLLFHFSFPGSYNLANYPHSYGFDIWSVFVPKSGFLFSHAFFYVSTNFHLLN